MTQIKSEMTIPKEVDLDIFNRGMDLRNQSFDPNDDTALDNESVAAIIFTTYTMGARDQYQIAETEAEERHAKELQELKDRAVEAFCSRCQCLNACPSRQCEVLDSFTQKLNEL